MNYILEGHKPVPIEDVIKWAKWLEANNDLTRVNRTRFLADGIIRREDITISTVFLGLDYSFGEGPPLLFETMIFGGEHDQYQKRYVTWDEAEEGHKKAVAMVKES